MTVQNVKLEQKDDWVSSALKVNLERTAVIVEIPEQYKALLDITAGHFGVQKKTRELLTELNHPFVNWEYVLNELKADLHRRVLLIQPPQRPA